MQYPAIESLERRQLLTPILHSLPGADHTIYLDFDGHTTQWTAFNSAYHGGADIVSPSFTTNETLITNIWKRVAEDFAPFNVNVTTQEPPAHALYQDRTGTDRQWGVRVVFTTDQSWLRDNVGYAVGGVGYLGSFTWTTDTPVFSFNTGEVAAAETASHEVGHSLGLSHDGSGSSAYYYGHGSGATGWAPIMGAGFGRQLSQWSKGEYAGANQLQDDLAIITTNNGFGYRPDQSERPLSLAGENTGLIERRDDVDTFTLDVGAGLLTSDARPFERGPNLDILATLTDAAGNEIATDNPLDALDAKIEARVPAGRYYLHIDGTGRPATTGHAGYSDYGSLGQYSIVASFEADPLPVIDLWFGYGDEQTVAAADAARVLPWAVDRIVAVNVDAAVSVSIVGRDGPLGFTFAYDVSTRTAVWTLATPVKRDRLTVSVGDTARALDVLFGDVNGDGTVNLADALLQRGRNGTGERWADTNGDGTVNLIDALLLRGWSGTGL